jgi:ABC-type Fe3+/spermidine/putrescine transport system ATPase subunit
VLAFARVVPGEAAPREGSAVRIAVRPEAIHLHPGAGSTADDGASRVAATVRHGVFNGATVHYHLDIDGGGKLVAALNPALAPDFAPGQRVVATWPPTAAIAFQAAP